MKVYTLLLFDSKYDSAHYCITCLRRSILAVDEFIMLYLKAASWLMYLKSRPHTSGLIRKFLFYRNRLPFVFQSCSGWTVSRHLFIILLSDQ